MTAHRLAFAVSKLSLRLAAPLPKVKEGGVGMGFRSRHPADSGCQPLQNRGNSS
jgi:hypothetical protein